MIDVLYELIVLCLWVFILIEQLCFGEFHWAWIVVL